MKAGKAKGKPNEIRSHPPTFFENSIFVGPNATGRTSSFFLVSHSDLEDSKEQEKEKEPLLSSSFPSALPSEPINISPSPTSQEVEPFSFSPRKEPPAPALAVLGKQRSQSWDVTKTMKKANQPEKSQEKTKRHTTPASSSLHDFDDLEVIVPYYVQTKITGWLFLSSFLPPSFLSSFSVFFFFFFFFLQNRGSSFFWEDKCQISKAARH